MSQGQYSEHMYGYDVANGPRYGGQQSRAASNVLTEQYHLNVQMLQELGRRQDRAQWAFAAVTLPSLIGVFLLLVSFDGLFLHRTISIVALLIGAPMCISYLGFQRRIAEHYNKNLSTIREIEEYRGGSAFSPVKEEPALRITGKAATFTSRCELFVPVGALATYLGVFVFVWRDKFSSLMPTNLWSMFF